MVTIPLTWWWVETSGQSLRAQTPNTILGFLLECQVDRVCVYVYLQQCLCFQVTVALTGKNNKGDALAHVMGNPLVERTLGSLQCFSYCLSVLAARVSASFNGRLLSLRERWQPGNQLEYIFFPRKIEIERERPSVLEEWERSFFGSSRKNFFSYLIGLKWNPKSFLNQSLWLRLGSWASLLVLPISTYHQVLGNWSIPSTHLIQKKERKLCRGKERIFSKRLKWVLESQSGRSCPGPGVWPYEEHCPIIRHFWNPSYTYKPLTGPLCMCLDQLGCLWLQVTQNPDSSCLK